MVTASWSTVNDAVEYRLYCEHGRLMAATPGTSVQVDIPRADLAARGFFVVGVAWTGEEGWPSDLFYCDTDCRKKYLIPHKVTGIGIEP